MPASLIQKKSNRYPDVHITDINYADYIAVITKCAGMYISQGGSTNL